MSKNNLIPLLNGKQVPNSYQENVLFHKYLENYMYLATKYIIFLHQRKHIALFNRKICNSQLKRDCKGFCEGCCDTIQAQKNNVSNNVECTML